MAEFADGAPPQEVLHLLNDRREAVILTDDELPARARVALYSGR